MSRALFPFCLKCIYEVYLSNENVLVIPRPSTSAGRLFPAHISPKGTTAVANKGTSLTPGNIWFGGNQFVGVLICSNFTQQLVKIISFFFQYNYLTC